MAEKTKPPSLSDALDATASPVYLVDGQRTIAVANSALCAWLDLPLEEIVGRRVEYHSEPAGDSDAALLTGLCPSPLAFGGERTHAAASCLGRDGRLRRRRAEFIPLRSDSSPAEAPAFSVLVVCAPHDLAPGESTSGQPDTDRWSDQLRASRANDADRKLHACLLGSGPTTALLRRQVDAAITSRSNALLLGKRGSGRAELARHIFDRSSVGDDARLIPVDVELLELDQTTDRIESAGESATQRPTALLFQNIDAVSADAHRTFDRALGPPSKVRVFATAERSDTIDRALASRIATITLHVPALADRPEDLPLLTQWSVELCNAGNEKQIAGLTEEALEKLHLYSWPGGFSELRSAIAAAHNQCQRSLIDAADLPLVVQQAALAAELPQRTAIPIALDEFLSEIEHEIVVRALRMAGGNKAEAARLLGLTRPRLYRLLTKTGLGDELDAAGGVRGDEPPAEGATE